MRAAAYLVGYEKRIGRMNPEHLELLLSREMPFGKYKGRVIADLPGYYLAWFARKGFPPGQLGQLLALGAILIVMAWWRRSPAFVRHAYASNTLLMAAGFVLIGFQLTGYFVS